MKRTRFLILICCFIAILLLIGFTYGFYSLIIKGNLNGKTFGIETKYLAVEYADGTAVMNFDGDYLFPGNTAVKTFTVKNTGTSPANYNIFLDEVANDFERVQDLRYKLYIDEDAKDDKDDFSLLVEGAINNNEIQYLYYDKLIETGKTHLLKFVFEYAATSESQNVDMNKSISLRFNIDVLPNVYAESANNTLTFVGDGESLNNYIIYGNSIQGLPTSYQRVNYVGQRNDAQSSPTLNAYIDTGIVATSEIDAEVDFLMPIAQNANRIPFGAMTSKMNFGIGFNSQSNGSKFQSAFGTNGYTTTDAVTAVTNTRMKLRLNKTGAYYNGELILSHAAKTFDIGLNIYLGMLNNNGTAIGSRSYGAMRFYGFKIYDSGVLVRDFVPSYRTEDNVAGFYDLVENKFYGSSNDYPFAAGSDLNDASSEYPIKISNVGDYDAESGKYIIPVVFNGETVNVLLDEPLRKVGEYVDYIDFKKQAVVRNVEVIDDTGTVQLEESYKGLDTPIVTPLNLPSVITNSESNVIEINTIVSPSNIYVEY